MAFGTPEIINTINPTSGIAAATFGNALVAAYNTGYGISYSYTTNGYNWTTQAVEITSYEPNYNSRPSLAVYGDYLVLSYTSGSIIRTAWTTNIASGFTVNPSSSVPFSVNSGSSLAAFNNQLYLSYTTGSNNNPVLCSTQSITGGFTSSSSCQIDYGIEIGNDPALLSYGGVLVLQGKANYSEDNLWGTTYSTQGSFSPQYEYGQSLTQSPSLATFNGQIYECARSKNGSNIWCYYN